MTTDQARRVYEEAVGAALDAYIVATAGSTPAPKILKTLTKKKSKEQCLDCFELEDDCVCPVCPGCGIIEYYCECK
jgi:hypothetical protein